MTMQDDWTLQPLNIVNKIYDEYGSTGEWSEKVSQYFNKVTSEPAVLKKLPWLNETPLHNLKSSQVVRFRGMIQDMFDTEFYLDTYQVINNNTKETRRRPGRYCDVATCGPNEEIVSDFNQCDTKDRSSYYCVSIPAETSWVKKVYEESNPVNNSSLFNNQGIKRPVENEDDSTACEDLNNQYNMEVETCDSKRKCEGTSSDATTACTSNNNKAISTTDLNHPIPGSTGIACIVKLYNNESFSLNDHIEVVGIVSLDPMITACEGEEEMTDVTTLPPSLVPRLHALSVKKMDHANPLLHSSASELCRSPFAAVEDPQETRALLHQVLKEALLGDAGAADMLMCHLVSSVYMRQDIKPMGKFSLNISGIDRSLQHQEYTKKLFQVIEMLCTQAYFYPVTIQGLNSLTFIPKKNYDTNRLESGLLQLGQHTHLVVDETTLTKGQLGDTGVRNISALAKMIKWQKVDYNFQFHNLEQLTDVPVLILSEAKAMIESDAEVKLNPTNSDVDSAFSNVERLLVPEVLKRMRIFITAARLSDFTLNDQMQQMVQDDFVESRKNKSGVTGEDLHEMLILSRLLSKSCGESVLTQEIWNSAKQLYKDRKSRLTHT